MKNILKAFDKLNSPLIVDGDVLSSCFDFDYRIEEDGSIVIFDKNEEYSINFEEEMQYLDNSIEKEFNCKINSNGDYVHEQLEDAVKKDFGKNAYLDWLSCVELIVCK